MTRPAGLCIVLILIMATGPACFVRRRAVSAPAARRYSQMVPATKDELIQRLAAISNPIHSFNMSADLSPSILNPAKGVVTDYATVSAYVLFLRPDDIRILGRDPVIGSTIFDMVSNGQQFRVSIPPKKRFIIGNNSAPPRSGNKLEDLRPEALLTSLIIYPPKSETEITLMESDTERSLYILLLIRRNQDQFQLAREVYFDGHTLQVSRQKTFQATGNIASDTRYSEWKNYGGIPYPSGIDIQRPAENYEVQLEVLNMKFNTPDVTADKFVLNQPPDTKLEELK